jgi:hypothetical protein
LILKLDGMIAWDWIQALWATWIVLAGGIGLSIAVVVLFLVRLYSTLTNGDPWKDGTPKTYSYLFLSSAALLQLFLPCSRNDLSQNNSYYHFGFSSE